MKKRVAFVCVVFVAFQSFAQTSKDSAATAVLVQMSATTGWSSPPADAIATASVTSYRGEVAEDGTLTLKANGSGKSRTESATRNKAFTYIVNRGRAAVSLPDGNGVRHSISESPYNLPYHFPFFTPLAAFDQADVALAYQGMEAVNGEDSHRIEFTRLNLPDRDRHAEARRFTVWISATTLLPVKLESVRPATGNPNVLIRSTRYFADYRRVGSVLIPFRQIETVQGQLVLELRLESVQLNVGLSDEEFKLPQADSSPSEVNQ